MNFLIQMQVLLRPLLIHVSFLHVKTHISAVHLFNMLFFALFLQLINLLGLNSRSFNLTGVGQDLKNVKIEAVQGQAQSCVQNAGKRR